MTATLRLFLAGDVMLGRGIDQILPHPGDPVLFEGYLKSATDYVELAERRCGPIPRAVPSEYVWGELLGDLDERSCDLRLVNLETAITAAGQPEPKGINYRMHPRNIPVLSAARIDACTLANNHVADWGRSGLAETLECLKVAGIGRAGAGLTADEAAAPLVLDVPGRGRVLVLAYGAQSSGIPSDWAAGPILPGINILPDTAEELVTAARSSLASVRRRDDLVMASIHWGGNWGYGIGRDMRTMAHALIDKAGVDIVHGHSSHHPKAAEVHNGKLILYGCGDLINDYEGIGGQEHYRGDLVLAYVVDVSTNGGTLQALSMLPYRIRAFRLRRTDEPETACLTNVMDRECGAFGGHVTSTPRQELCLSWGQLNHAQRTQG